MLGVHNSKFSGEGHAFPQLSQTNISKIMDILKGQKRVPHLAMST